MADLLGVDENDKCFTIAKKYGFHNSVQGFVYGYVTSFNHFREKHPKLIPTDDIFRVINFCKYMLPVFKDAKKTLEERMF